MEEYKNSREKTEPQWRYILRLILNIMIPASGWFFLCFLGPKLLGFFMPFVVGWIIAMIANPLVRFRAQAEAGAQAQLYCDRGRSSGSGDRAFISCCIPNASFYLVLYPGSSGLICRD